MTPATAKAVPLARPITIDKVQATSLLVDPDFKIGWLRGAPTTPVWFIGIVKGLLSGLDLASGVPAADIDPAAMLAKVPVPSGEEVSEMIPWLLHIAEKATGQPPSVVDQLAPSDLFAILLQLIPGMIALANFPRTSVTGAVTSPGSSAGRPAT